jgi:hypothetical protein
MPDGFAIFELTIFAILYIAPTVVAGVRRHPQSMSIYVVNLFLGWTMVGWVVALAMAVSHIDKPPRVTNAP